MTMHHITEIIPDLKDLPEWARKAFEDGQYFNVVAAKIKQIEESEAKTELSIKAAERVSHAYFLVARDFLGKRELVKQFKLKLLEIDRQEKSK